MVREIGEAAALEMLAEECTELAQAVLKLARVVRGENPTPVSEDRAHGDVMEEWADVLVCSDVFDEVDWYRPEIVAQTMRFKKRRMNERIRNE